MCLPPRVYRIAHLFEPARRRHEKSFGNLRLPSGRPSDAFTIGCMRLNHGYRRMLLVEQFTIKITCEAAKSLQRFEQFPDVGRLLQDARRAWLTVNAPLEPLLDRFVEPPPAVHDDGNAPGLRHAPQSPQETFRIAIRHALIGHYDGRLLAPRHPETPVAVHSV
jgi:hypothetical protein